MTRIPDLVDRAVSLSKADGCIVLGRESSQANVRWANNTSTTNGVIASSGLTVISIRDGRVGSVSRSYVPDDELEDLVRTSEAACEERPKAEDEMPLVEGGADPGFGDDVPDTGIEVFGSFAPDLAGAFDRARTDDQVLYGYAEHTTSTAFLGTSTGLRRRHTHTEGTVEFTAKPPDMSSSAWVGRTTAAFTDVDCGLLYDRLAQRLAWSKNHIDLPAGRYEVILEPSAATDMCLYAYFSAVARDADEGRSVYSKAGGGTRVGDQMFGKDVTLRSDPSERDMEVAPFQVVGASSSRTSVFDNGLDVRPTEWVRDGVLTSLVMTRHWAAEHGGEPTSFINNLIFESDGPTLEEMIANTERALLVTALWYIRTVDPRTLLLTGLTRDGVFLVEDGEVKGAVNNYRFNESPVDMLSRTVEIGRSERSLGREIGDAFPFVRMPPLRVEGFNMSSVSQAT